MLSINYSGVITLTGRGIRCIHMCGVFLADEKTETLYLACWSPIHCYVEEVSKHQDYIILIALMRSFLLDMNQLLSSQ
jgi:hypothetical protein